MSLAFELTSGQWARSAKDWTTTFCEFQQHPFSHIVPYSLWTVFFESQEVGLITCVRSKGVQGVLTLICGGVAKTSHDDRVVELKEQLGIEEEDGKRQEGPVKEEGRDRVKENAPWMTWR